MRLLIKASSTTKTPATIALWILASFCGIFATVFAVRYANQTPLDHYSLRQTQTGLTAYWLGRNGFSLAYETPVAGPPWSIPFEFPIYQWIVSSVSRLTGASLDPTGRLTSFAFFIACLFPVRTIVRRLDLSPMVFPLFAALFLASPTYLYWARGFMIETAALFFCLMGVRYFVDMLVEPANRKSAWLCALFMTLGGLQKITTAAPIILVLGLTLVVMRVKSNRRIMWQDVFDASLAFGIPVALSLIWVVYTDRIKLENQFGQQLTSSVLRGWNLGPWSQRITKPLYSEVIYTRVFKTNLGAYIGVIALLIGGLTRFFSKSWFIFFIAMLLAILPDLIFANLHLRHDYYEAGNLVFAIFAIAVAAGDVLPRFAWHWVTVAMAIAIVNNDYRVFRSDYIPPMREIFTDDNSKELAISRILNKEIPDGKAFIAFDFDWSSALSYLSRRKSFTVSTDFFGYSAAQEDPARFMSATDLGGVVACPTTERPFDQLFAWSTHGRRWKVGATRACLIAVPESAPSIPRDAQAVNACGVVDLSVIPIEGFDSYRMVRLRLQPSSDDERPTAFVVSSPIGASSSMELLDVGLSTDTATSVTSPVRFHEFTRVVSVDAMTDASKPRRLFRSRGDAVDECRLPVD